MPRIPGVSQKDAIRALGKAGFVIVRQGRHVIMRKGDVPVQIPRHTQINAITMGDIAKTAGLTPEQFKTLL
jgi:predicted RNA binding protein YcfA (HicA-like mRNA interferase family)